MYQEFFKEEQQCSQQDADEFIKRLMEQLTTYPKENNAAKKVCTAIKNLFYVTQKTSIFCPIHDKLPSYTSEEVKDTIATIELATYEEIPGHPRLFNSLTEALHNYFGDHPIEFTVANVKRTNCVQRSRIIQLPEYAMIQLKRTLYKNNTLQKTNRLIEVPLSLTFPTSSQPYALVGAIVQSGSAIGGHYWSYINKNGLWYKCDDSLITPLGKELPEQAQKEINGYPSHATHATNTYPYTFIDGMWYKATETEFIKIGTSLTESHKKDIERYNNDGPHGTTGYFFLYKKMDTATTPSLSLQNPPKETPLTLLADTLSVLGSSLVNLASLLPA
jgi:hypothetical protein